MEVKESQTGMLDLLLRPGFCVKENKITEVNRAAQGLLITPGTDVRTLLATGTEEYETFSGGCLYLKLALISQGCGATVIRNQEQDVFILDQETDAGELQALALAARQLRDPLTSVMIAAHRLDAQCPEQAARLNRGLYQLLRIIGNMSDAGRYTLSSRQELQDIDALFAEIFDKALALVAHTGITMTYQGLSQELLCLCDGEQLERAALNLISNAVKFTPAGGSIEVSLHRTGRMLQLRIQDSGSGIAEQLRSSVFSRYLRQPGIEDSRCGLGLGMVLVRSAAANHGGTVFIDQPKDRGTRVTMTLAIRQSQPGTLHSPVIRVDYTGEQDHGLIELSDSLPIGLYETD